MRQIHKSAKLINTAFEEYEANLTNKAGRMKAGTYSEHVAKVLLVRAEDEHSQDYLQNWCKAESNCLGWDFSRNLRCQTPPSHFNSAYQKVQAVLQTAGDPKFPLQFYNLFQHSSKLSLTLAGTHVALYDSSDTNKYLLILANIFSYCFVSLLTLSIHF